MQYIGQYCKQFFKSTFHRKSDLDILKENIKNNPTGLFFSLFETSNHKIAFEESFGRQIEITYNSYHLFFGNDMDNIGYIVSTDLAHTYQNIAHHQSIVSFNELPLKIQEKLVLNSDKISNFKQIDIAMEQIFEKTKDKIPYFIIPENKKYYENLAVIFFKNKMALNLSDKPEKTKSTKI